MGCNACIVRDLRFEIRAEGDLNIEMLSGVIEHLVRRKTLVKSEGNKFIIKESGMMDFIDFSQDHMDFNEVFFRLEDSEWRVLTEVKEILENQWIDEVISKGLVTCYAQPIMTADEEIYAYELLARFLQEDGSLIFPGEIFSAAKSRGRLYALDRLCRMTGVRYAALLDKKAFINFIPTSIYSPEHCLKSTVQLANQLDLDPNQLVFEVVETEKVDDINHLKSILAYYKEKGFHYALDDVGEGYSTLELLEELKPHYMKLDMKYVQGVAADIEKQKTAKKSLEQALKMGAVPLAEGIEDREDFEWLRDLGYQLFQGYLFGKPAPIEKAGNKDAVEYRSVG